LRAGPGVIARSKVSPISMSFASLRNSPLVALPLRNANLGVYALGSGVSLVGMWMQRIAVGWLTWQLTES
jgi:hypothetical protein